MIAAPAIHQTLFFLSVLFGINIPMIGQQAVVDIHFADKTGSITYKHIVTSEEHAHQAKEALKQLHDAPIFNKRFNFMQLVDKTITVEQGDLQVKVMFRYENEQVLLDRLGFHKNEQGDIIYKILDRETYLTSTGKQQEDQVKWPAETSEVHLEITGASLEEDEKEASISLAGYWEE